MKRKLLKRVSILSVLACILLVLCSCARTETNLAISRNGSGVVTAQFLMANDEVKEIYGMPTKFYDAVEKDGRFAKVMSWNKEYVDYEIDGVNYIGVQVSKNVSKKEIQNALNELYGQYASVTYEDKNTFGNRTVKINFSSNSHLMAEELQSALDGGLVSNLTITTPAAISSTTGNKVSDKTVVLDLTNLLTGKETGLNYEIKFFDFTFYIPIAAIAIVVIAGGTVFLVRFTKNKKRNAGLSSIDLKSKPKSGGFGGFGSGKSGGMDDLDNYKPKSGMSFSKKTPRYDSKNAAPETPSAPAPAPVAPSAPAAQTPGEAAPASRPTPTPAFRSRVPKASPVAPAPAVEETPVAPAETPVPAYSEPAPAYSEPAPAYSEPAPAYSEPAPSYSEPAPSYSEPAPSYSEPAPAYTEPAYSEPAPVYTSTIDSPNSIVMGRKHEEPKVDYSIAGSARFVKGEKNTEHISNASTLFTPRSTAPNMAYGSAEYTEFERSKHQESEHLSSGSTLFTPRSTAPTLGYGTAEYTEQERAHHQEPEHFTTGSVNFTPRSTAANLNYGKEPPKEDVFEKKHTPDPSITSLFTPRSTAPNLNYGLKEPLFEEEEPEYHDPFFEPDKKQGAHTQQAQPQSTQPVYEQPQSAQPAYEQPPYEQSAYTEPSYDQSAYAEPSYDQGAYAESSYDQGAYAEPSYDQGAYDQGGYTEDTYNQDAYDQGYYDQGGNDSYEETSYQDGGYYEETPAQAGSIYQTNGYDSSPYQSASYGASEKSEAISSAYGGSKLGSGAYLGGSATGTRVGRSVGNIGGYVDETSVNTSSYGSDPFASGSPLPKLGESGVGGGGMFSIDSTGGFGSTNSYEGKTIGGGSFGGGSFGGAKYTPGESYTPPTNAGNMFETHTEHPNFGKTFHTGGSGKFDFGMAGGDSKRKCPFCKAPIRDDDVFCVACGAELSRPYGSF